MDDEALDGEGVWAPDIERAFHEALAEYPACGRRKHILPDEGGGKMYGRNELIALYIYNRTGKHRTRKQVSSHIQVLARRKNKMGGSLASPDDSTGTPSPGANMRSVSASSQCSAHPQEPTHNSHPHSLGLERRPAQSQHPHAIGGKREELDFWFDRPLASRWLRLVQFAAFVERPPSARLAHHPQWAQPLNPLDPTHYPHHAHHAPAAGHRHDYVQIDYRRAPAGGSKLEQIAISQVQDKFSELGGLSQRCQSDAIYLVKFWADLNHELERQLDDDQNSYFGFSSHFEALEPLGELSCSTRACSYGQQVVEKVDRMRPTYNLASGRYSYAVDRSPMCEFMIQFIKKLRQLPRIAQMNSVLENFTILQVITNESTSEVLLCLALVFEINSTNRSDGSQHHVYQLTKDCTFNTQLPMMRFDAHD